MIKVANLTKRYGRVTAVEDLSFEVARGEIVGLLGPNGAGKSTTLRILSCFIPPTSGVAMVGGRDVFQDSLEVRSRIGYLPENAPLYPDMRVREYLRFRAAIRGLYGRRRRARIRDVVEHCGLGGVERRIIGQLSRGYRQRVALADCLLHDPEVLILDEPSLGLDPGQTRDVRNLIRNMAGRRTVLLSTHALSEVEATCSRALILHRGRMVASDSPQRLSGLCKGRARFVAELQGPADAVVGALRDIPGAQEVRRESGDGDWCRYVVEAEAGTDLRPGIFAAAARNGWTMRELRAESGSLEDAFLFMTEGEGRP